MVIFKNYFFEFMLIFKKDFFPLNSSKIILLTHIFWQKYIFDQYF